MDAKKNLEKIKLFVLDMDGTFYLGENIIDGSLAFLDAVKKAKKDFLFFTNNSSKTSAFYQKRLERMNCDVSEADIMTSGDVTIEYLKTNYPKKSVYLLGTPLLYEHFDRAGIILSDENPDIAVAAFDTALTYEKLSKFCTFVRDGALFLATHPDINCPTETGFIPDCGAMCQLISISTGKVPKYLGKPFSETVDMIVSKTGFLPDEIAFIGDRLYTDIATGVNNGATGILVLTGEATLEDVKKSEIKPTFICNSLYDMVALI